MVGTLIESEHNDEILCAKRANCLGSSMRKDLFMSNAYDAIIVGTGQAGAPLAGRLSEAGMKVAIIERKLFGGTCVNTGCTPTKTLVASAYAAHLARRAADFGLVINGEGRHHSIGRNATGVGGLSRWLVCVNWIRTNRSVM